MFFKGLVTVLVCDALFVILAIPLILRKVPRSVVYGFRTCRTLSDDFLWYETNAYFGHGLVVSSFISAAAVLMVYGVGSVSQRFFLVSTIVALVVPPLVTTLLTLRFVRSLTPGGSAGTHTGTTPR